MPRWAGRHVTEPASSARLCCGFGHRSAILCWRLRPCPPRQPLRGTFLSAFSQLRPHLRPYIPVAYIPRHTRTFDAAHAKPQCQPSRYPHAAMFSNARQQSKLEKSLGDEWASEPVVGLQNVSRLQVFMRVPASAAASKLCGMSQLRGALLFLPRLSLALFRRVLSQYGNTCYCNSVLQVRCLASPSRRDWMHGDDALSFSFSGTVCMRAIPGTSRQLHTERGRSESVLAFSCFRPRGFSAAKTLPSRGSSALATRIETQEETLLSCLHDLFVQISVRLRTAPSAPPDDVGEDAEEKKSTPWADPNHACPCPVPAALPQKHSRKVGVIGPKRFVVKLKEENGQSPTVTRGPFCMRYT